MYGKSVLPEEPLVYLHLPLVSNLIGPLECYLRKCGGGLVVDNDELAGWIDPDIIDTTAYGTASKPYSSI